MSPIMTQCPTKTWVCFVRKKNRLSQDACGIVLIRMSLTVCWNRLNCWNYRFELICDMVKLFLVNEAQPTQLDISQKYARVMYTQHLEEVYLLPVGGRGVGGGEEQASYNMSSKICTTVPKGHAQFTEINCPKLPSQHIHISGTKFSQTPKTTNSHPRNDMVSNSQDNTYASRNPEAPHSKISVFIMKRARLLLYFRRVLYSIPIQFRYMCVL